MFEGFKGKIGSGGILLRTKNISFPPAVQINLNYERLAIQEVGNTNYSDLRTLCQISEQAVGSEFQVLISKGTFTERLACKNTSTCTTIC